MEEQLRSVLDFWFAPGMQDRWFERSNEFDAEIASRFAALYEQARRGELDGWAETADGALALILLLDQFPRNLFRGSARAFESDQHARILCRAALARGFDRGRTSDERRFLYLPLEHSESLRDQRDCVDLFRALGDPEALDYAIQHYEIIARFGCFPHRNDAMMRQCTPEELAFLETHKGF